MNNRKYNYDKVYEFCSSFYEKNYRPASMKNVSESMGIPYGATILHIFQTLEAEGKLVVVDGRYIPKWVIQKGASKAGD